MIYIDAIRRYGQLICIIYKEVRAEFPQQILAISFLSICSVTALTISFAGYFVLINEWVKQSGLSLGPWTFYFHGDIPLTFFMATFLLILGVIGAWCSFFIELKVARTAIRYYQACGIRFVRLINHPDNDGWQGFFSNGLKQELTRMINSDLQKRGMIAKHLLQGILPGFTCIVAGLIMFYTNWSLSIFVILISLIFMPYFFKINQSTAALQKAFEDIGETYRSRFSYLLKSSLQKEDNSKDSLTEFISGDLFFQQKFMFLRRFTQGDKIQALNSTFFVIILYILIIFYILSVDNNAVGWKKLLIFGIAFRFFFNSFRNVAGIISTCSRLYPGTRRLDLLADYCHKLRTKGKITGNELFQKLLTLELFDTEKSTPARIRVGILHWIYVASPELEIDSIKQSIALLIISAAPNVNILSDIEIINNLSNTSTEKISSAMNKGFSQFMEGHQINDSAITSAEDHNIPSEKTVLLYKIWEQSKKHPFIFILSSILSSPLHRLLKRIANQEKNLLIFILTTKKGLRKFADDEEGIIVFKEFHPMITSVKNLFMTDKSGLTDEEDLFDEV
ncbi:MAG: hypothetical protein C4548_06250 [Desulfobacteraceae bacterium]|jgi:ABC-type multidrug transport system fused ATPase/permease subunit|nr:MAG: hypothetical protein C4548_06250 [Desulfobacteraceae bacterium]